MTREKKNNLSRRDALKVLGAAAGAVALANVPEKWSSPELASGVLPAHAQTSECGDYMQAVATTTTLVQGEYGDFDFSLCTPNGNYVWGGTSADGATSSPDNIAFIPHVDNETLEIASAIPGTYSIYLENWSGGAALEISVSITTAAGTQTINLTLTSDRAVADITFPCGTVTLRNDNTYPPCLPNPDIRADKKKKK